MFEKREGNSCGNTAGFIMHLHHDHHYCPLYGRLLTRIRSMPREQLYLYHYIKTFSPFHKTPRYARYASSSIRQSSFRKTSRPLK